MFEQLHAELLAASTSACEGGRDIVDLLIVGFGVFLDKVLEPEVQRILLTDAMRAANDGALRVDDPPTLTRLPLGALTRAGLYIVGSAEPTETRAAMAVSLRALITGFAPRPGGF